MPRVAKHFTTLSPSEVQAVHQLRTLISIVDKALTPVDLPVAPPAPDTAADFRGALKKAADAAQVARKVIGRGTGPRVTYRPVDGRVKAPRGVSATDQRVYAVIRRMGSVTRGRLLTALRVGTRTGIVDGAVRRLRLAKVIQVISL